MKRQLVMFLALAATLAATAYLALQPEDDGSSVAMAVPLKRVAASVPVAAPAAARPEPVARAPWTALTPTALQAWAPPPPPTPPPRKALAAPPVDPATLVEAPKPGPPAFPYRWIGRLEQEGASIALLDGPQRSLGVQAGQVLDGQWRVERITHDRIELVWLPTGELLALDSR